MSFPSKIPQWREVKITPTPRPQNGRNGPVLGVKEEMERRKGRGKKDFTLLY